MMLSLDTAYRSFGGEVEASSTPTICRLSDSRRHQLPAIALWSATGSARRGGRVQRIHGRGLGCRLGSGSAVAAAVGTDAAVGHGCPPLLCRFGEVGDPSRLKWPPDLGPVD